MDPFFDVGSLKKQKSGQKICPKCHKQYNNRAIPNKCFNYQAFLGGNYKQTAETKDAKLISSSIASVRMGTTGVHRRVFVDLKENKVCKYMRHKICFALVFSSIKITLNILLHKSFS